MDTSFARKRCRRTGLKVAMLALIACAIVCAPTPARAAFDLTNRWILQVDEYAPGAMHWRYECTVDLVQTGTTITTVGPGDCFTLTGTVDPETRELEWAGILHDRQWPEFTARGTIDESGRSFFAAATGDAYVAYFTSSLCPNGRLDPGEECDEADWYGSCCSKTCKLVDDGTACTSNQCLATGACSEGECVGTPKPAGTLCELDSDGCTVDACDGAGTCAPGSCSPCCTGAGCTAERAMCSAGRRSRVHARSTTDGARNRLTYASPRSAAIDVADLGDPLTTTDYDVCLFRTVPILEAPRERRLELIVGVHVPAGGTCNGKPCWSQLTDGTVSYRNPKREGNGLASLKIRPGESGQAGLELIGRGPNLRLPDLLGPLSTGGVVVRVQNPDSCWESVFDLNRERGSVNHYRELRARRGKGRF